MAIDWNDVSANSSGGTELMCRRLEESIPKDLLDEFQIIPSRVREIDESKIRILYLHDLPTDPESKHLANGGWSKFHKLVFVTHWQREWYVRYYNIPYSKTIILQNAIMPIEDHKKPETDTINFIYHTTPHRGLELLVPVFERLAETKKNIHLDVYSSFSIYGWEERDKHFQKVFEKIKDHPQMTFHGFKPNEEIRKALKKAHIYAYPCIWQETSCLSLMEAMSAGCVCVHSDLGALPETAANWTYMYGFDENHNRHAGTFHGILEQALELFEDKNESMEIKLKGQKSYVDLFYNWDVRKNMWIALLESMLELPRELEKAQEVFTYSAR